MLCYKYKYFICLLRVTAFISSRTSPLEVSGGRGGAEPTFGLIFFHITSLVSHSIFIYSFILSSIFFVLSLKFLIKQT